MKVTLQNPVLCDKMLICQLRDGCYTVDFQNIQEIKETLSKLKVLESELSNELNGNKYIQEILTIELNKLEPKKEEV